MLRRGRPQIPSSGALRILVEPGTFDCLNMGDVAMLKVAIARLKCLWPACQIQVLTDDPDALLRQCPEVLPVVIIGRRDWARDQFVLGRFNEVLPGNVSELVIRAHALSRRYWPKLEQSILRRRMRSSVCHSQLFKNYLEAIEKADLVVVSGVASFADMMPMHAKMVLDMLERATTQGKPITMFSQGIGPLSKAWMMKRASRVLPRVELIAVREGRSAIGLLTTLGVSPDRVVITGDDAIEMSYSARREVPGTALGVNVRLARYTALDQEVLGPLREILQNFARRESVPLVPLPIAFHSVARDPQNIREVLKGYDDSSDGGLGLSTPQDVIQQVGRCRAVVTGAYHAAVFALAQGVPVVCLAKSQYVREKFLGLSALFGTGCEIIDLGKQDYPVALQTAIERVWTSAETFRSDLLAAAIHQIESGYAAYLRAYESLTGVNAPEQSLPIQTLGLLNHA